MKQTKTNVFKPTPLATVVASAIFFSFFLAFSGSLGLSVSKVFAANEKLTMNAAGDTITGSGGTFADKKITPSSGGAPYAIGTTFTKKDSNTWITTDPVQPPSQAHSCIITLTIPPTSSLKVTDAKYSCAVSNPDASSSVQVDSETGLPVSELKDDRIRLDMSASFDRGDILTGLKVASVQNSDGSTASDPAFLQETIAAIGPALDGVKTEYYRALGSKAPCSSSGCDDSEWNTMVQSCWVTSRSAAAETARYSAQAGRIIDREALTKENFSKCVSDKTGISKDRVLAATESLDVSKVNGATMTARENLEAEAEKECTDQGLVLSSDGECVELPSSCAIQYVGWIVCPVINFAASMADKAYELLSKNFLEIPVSYLANDQIYESWQAFQSIANVILVILFLIIIFSQLTSVGITNYGIKKLLPKIIIVAILMNLSFIICSLAVDISNILGYGLKDTLTNLAPENKMAGSNYYNFGSTGSGAGGWAILAGTALAGGAIGVAASGGVTLAVIALIPVLFAALSSLIMIFFILVGRQVLILLLIVISPVAFALSLLPNTAQWFAKWRKTFVALLMVFPIIGLVYGASSLASGIMSSSYSVGDNESMIGEIITAGIMVIPLIIVPSLLKKSLDSVGNIGAMAGKLNAKMSGGLKNKLDNSGVSKHLGKNSERRQAMTTAGIDPRRGGRANPANWKARVNKAVTEGAKGQRNGFINAVGKGANYATEGYMMSKGHALDKFNNREIQETASSMAGWTHSNGSLKSADEILAETRKAYDDSGATSVPAGKSLSREQSAAQNNYIAAQLNKRREDQQGGIPGTPAVITPRVPVVPPPSGPASPSGPSSTSTPPSGPVGPLPAPSPKVPLSSPKGAGHTPHSDL